MIDTLALAIVMTPVSGGICKTYVPPFKATAAPVVSFRGVGPKRLAVSVSDTLLSQGFGGPVLSSRFQMSLRSPRSPGILTPIQTRPTVSQYESSFASRSLGTPVAAPQTASSLPPKAPADIAMTKANNTVAIETVPRGYDLGTPVAVIASPSALLPGIPSVQQSAPVVTAANKFAEPAPLTAMDKRVSIALSATPLETVVGLLSKQTGINIVLISKPDQKVTISVKDMPLSEAMKHLSALAGVRVLKVRNTLVMADDAVLKLAYPAEYAAESVAKAADPQPSTGSGTTTTSATTAEPATKGEDAFKVVALKHLGATAVVSSLKEYAAKIGVSLVAMPNSLVPRLNLAASNTAVTPAPNDQTGDNSRTILVTGPSKAVSQIEAIIGATDIARRQVQITVTIHDVSDSALNEQGIQWVPGQFNVSEATNASPNLGTFQRSGVSFSATMKALEQKDKARLLSSPNVNVMDGESSSILIGEKRQFPIVASFNTNGQPVFSIQELKIGIQLDVSAQITADGSITLAVRPEVSSIIEFLNVNGGTYPQIATRSSENKLTMHDGDTMVIGGLVKEEDIKNYQRLPLLSNIPFFGELFKSRRLEKRKAQLIISITPNIIKQ